MGIVLIVDAANVVGSRPDGWWRDRVGAAERLLTRLAAVPGTTYDDAASPTTTIARVVAVLEGAARAARVPDGVEAVLAPRDGDSTIVEVARAETAAGQDVVVVTADRGLRDRLGDTATIGPGRLLRMLDEAG
jgi:hypothetical protein